jgi:uncharacterized protein YbjT (DUF2867 family)
MQVQSERFCDNLTTLPIPGTRVLVTGATGYIGGQLVPELLARGYHVRIMIRNNPNVYSNKWPGAEIVKADVLEYLNLKNAMKGVHCAYYLIHSLNLGKKSFREVDRQAAINFRKAAEENHLERIIYLGGLGNKKVELSDHLRSRLIVAEELKKGRTPLTFLRSAVIVGFGSTSYKMIRSLVQNCPFFLFPSKANSKCQPIAIRDVIKYLVGCLENENTKGKSYDIGGQDILSYEKMLKEQAALVGKKRIFMRTSLFSVNLYARITSLMTPLPYRLIKCLMESCVNDVVCENTDIREQILFQPLTYQEAIIKALEQKAKIQGSNSEEASLTSLGHKLTLTPPTKSNGIFADIKNFLLHKPKKSTLIKFNSLSQKQEFNYRILQRLAVKVSDYKILNIHKIGVNAPAKYVFEELLKWNGDSTCWPNHIAEIVREDDNLESLFVYLFGWKNYPAFIKKILNKWKLIPLFKLNAIHFQKTPDPSDSDNARYLLYESLGGYPIGVFTMYVRSSIEGQNESEQSQLFLMVGFNFYGKEYLTKRKLLNRPWEMVHDRVTSNVVTRIKQLCEWRFEKIQAGKY